MDKKKKSPARKPKNKSKSPPDNFSVPLTPGTTITISNTGTAASAPVPVQPAVPARKPNIFQPFINPLIGAIIVGGVYYLFYINRYTGTFLASIWDISWAFLFVFLLALCIALFNGIKLLYIGFGKLFRKIPNKPVINILSSIVTIILTIAILFLGKAFLIQNAFYYSVMAGLHDSLIYVNIEVPSTDGGKWNGNYTFNMVLGKCTGSAATEVDINALIKQAITAKTGGITVLNSRVNVYKDGFIDANGVARSTYTANGANLILDYKFMETGGVSTYTGAYRMWDTNSYVQFDCSGGINGKRI